MKVGYVRVSTAEQNTARQEDLMHRLNVEKIYIEKISGKDTQRPALREMLLFVREGDTLIVESISRFARNTKDLLELVEQLEQKHVSFVSQKENIDTATPAGRFMLTVFGAMAQLEREYILDRQLEGITLAKSRGVYKGRVPIPVDERRFEAVYRQWKAGELTAVKAMNILGLKANTFYRRVRAFEGR